MHNLFREELDAAKGVSEFVVAQNVDIRGFSDWSLEVDSAQSALYVKKVYAKLIDQYFSTASFVKPTGDGLLVVTSFEEPDLERVATKAVTDSMEIVGTFHSLCDDENMINFPVPKDVGIGIARGAASRLAAPKRTLDYSGRVLNLASRLMDLARPRGIILDESFGLDLLPESISSAFHQDSAVLRGVSPTRPVAVHCWPDEVQVPEEKKQPLEEDRWEHRRVSYTLKGLQDLSFDRYRIDLDPPPLRGFEPEAEVEFPAITPGGNMGNQVRYSPVPLHVSQSRGSHSVTFDVNDLTAMLTNKDVQPDWSVTVKVSYRVP